MRKALIYLLLLLLSVTLAAQAGETRKGRVVPMNGAFLRQLQERDSVLIADQLQYGFELKQVKEGTRFIMPEWKNDEKGGVQVLSPWLVDTLKATRQKKGEARLLDISGSVIITSFDEGLYELPQIAVQRLSEDGVVDTLVFDPMRLDVKTMPVDTTVFVPHDIKGQIRYPLTVKEVLPYAAGGWLVVTFVILAICLMMMCRRRDDPAYMRKDPAHIVALRRLDAYRGNKLWAPEKQKAFYSGVTDALREYMDSRYGIPAMEMTTAEIFMEMKSVDVSAELVQAVKELFERADFVKFAKYVASEEENVSVLPLAVRFVTETYQAEVENEIDDCHVGQSERLDASAESETKEDK